MKFRTLLNVIVDFFFFLLWISYNTLICVTNFIRKKNDIICRAKTRLFHWKYFVLLQNKKKTFQNNTKWLNISKLNFHRNDFKTLNIKRKKYTNLKRKSRACVILKRITGENVQVFRMVNFRITKRKRKSNVSIIPLDFMCNIFSSLRLIENYCRENERTEYHLFCTICYR